MKSSQLGTVRSSQLDIMTRHCEANEDADGISSLVKAVLSDAWPMIKAVAQPTAQVSAILSATALTKSMSGYDTVSAHQCQLKVVCERALHICHSHAVRCTLCIIFLK